MRSTIYRIHDAETDEHIETAHNGDALHDALCRLTGGGLALTVYRDERRAYYVDAHGNTYPATPRGPSPLLSE